MNTVYIHSCSVLCMLFLFACDTPTNLRQAPADTDTSIKVVKTDKIGNFFVVTDDGIFRKFDISGKIHFSYNNQSRGKITTFDVTDPMKILLFYKEIQQILVLDNTLSEISIIPLNNLAGRYFAAIARMYDGHIALFDINNEMIIKVDDKLNIEMEGFPLFQEGFPGFSPTQIMCDAQTIMMNDPGKGLILLDNYFNFRKMISVVQAKLLHIDERGWVYYKNGMITKQDPKFYAEEFIELPKKYPPPVYVCYTDGKAVVFDPELIR